MIELFATVSSLALFVLALVGLIKERLRASERAMKGWATIGTSLLTGAALGAVFAQGGIAELRALAAFPAWASGAVLGVLAGVLASGGRAVVKGVQLDAARFGQAALEQPPAQPSPVPTWGSPATLDDLYAARTGEWPAPAWADDAPLAGER